MDHPKSQYTHSPKPNSTLNIKQSKLLLLFTLIKNPCFSVLCPSSVSQKPNQVVRPQDLRHTQTNVFFDTNNGHESNEYDVDLDH